MMADPEMAQQMMAAANQMLGGGDDGLDMGALAAQAQQLAQQDPELLAQLQKGLTAPGDDSDDGDGGQD